MKLFFNPTLDEIFHEKISIGKKSSKKSTRCVSSFALLKSLTKLKLFGIRSFNFSLQFNQKVTDLSSPNVRLFVKLITCARNIRNYTKTICLPGIRIRRTAHAVQRLEENEGALVFALIKLCAKIFAKLSTQKTKPFE